MIATGGAGTGGNGNGRAGAVLLPNGAVNQPALCGSNINGICFFWTGTTQNILAWRDCTGSGCPGTGNQVSAGADDQGVRLSQTGAIRFNASNLTGTFNNGGITTANTNDFTLAFCGTASCNTNDHGGNVTLTKATVSRVSDHNGTALVAGDFALSASWGSTATKTVNRGVDGAFSFTVTEGGTGQAANPTVTLTFHDGSWINVPVSTCNLDAATTDTFAPVAVKDTATTLIVTYIGTPATNKAVTFQCHTTGT